MVRLKSAGITDIGRRRKSNQDAFIIRDTKKLYVVADGMGGHKAGDVASRMTVAAIESYVETPVKQTRADRNNAASILENSIQFANSRVFEKAASDASCSGMGSTVSIVYFSGNTLTTANVGDSPIYMIRNKAIKTLSTPHTLLHEHRTARKKFKIPENMKLGHILTRAIGIRENIEADTCAFPFLENDIFIICSDGLSGKVSREEILKTAIKMEPEPACAYLTALANKRGGEDNITVVVIKVITAEPEKKKRTKNIFTKLRELFAIGMHL